MQRLERELRDTRLKEAQLQDEAEQVQHSVSAILQRREQLELTCADYSLTLRSGKSARERAAEELAKVNEHIATVEQRLTELKPEYKAARQKEDDLANNLSDAEHRRYGSLFRLVFRRMECYNRRLPFGSCCNDCLLNDLSSCIIASRALFVCQHHFGIRIIN